MPDTDLVATAGACIPEPLPPDVAAFDLLPHAASSTTAAAAIAPQAVRRDL